VYAAEFHQVVEKLRLKLSPLSCGDGLRTTRTDYPSVQQGAFCGVCRDIQDGNDFQPVRDMITAVRKYKNPAEVGGPIELMWTCKKRAAASVKSPNRVTLC
jgi:hypothetical protein